MLSTHNVPGALSSSSRRDFKAVLEAFADAEVPMPGSGRWANAGMVRGRGVDLAWCVYDAQYFGTAQRRRRIFLVADLRGERAGEILFVPKSLSGYFAAGGTPRQGLAAYAQNGAGTAGAGIDGYNAQTPRSKQILVCCEEFVPLHIMSTSLSLLFAFYSELIVPAPSNRQFSKCVIPKIVPLLLYAKKVQFVFETAKRPAASDGPCQFILYPSGC